MSLPPEGTIFLYGLLFNVARKAYERTQDETDEQRFLTAAPTAIVFAAMSLEGFINEVELFLHVTLPNVASVEPEIANLASALREIEAARGSIELKYIMAAIALGKPFDKGSNPYQDFSLLIDLRNALMHFKGAKTVASADGTVAVLSEQKLMDRLRGKGILRANPNVGLYSAIGTTAAAGWACNTAASMITSLVSRLPDSGAKYRIVHSSSMALIESFHYWSKESDINRGQDSNV